MVFQSYALYPHLTVRENLAFGLELRKTPEGDDRRARRGGAEILGLGRSSTASRASCRAGSASAWRWGARSCGAPRLFLFDEPLSNLDAALRAQVRVDIRKLHDRLDATSVYVTHDQVEAMTLADVMFVLNRGRRASSGAAARGLRKPPDAFVAGFSAARR
jgi:ABC-type sugar transport system ATPase subunit